MRLAPSSLLWRTLAVMLAALVLSQAAATWLFNEFVTRPRHDARVGECVSHRKTISAALETMPPQAQQRFIDAIAEKEGIRIVPAHGDERMRPAEGAVPLRLFREHLREIFGPQAEVYVRRGDRERGGAGSSRPTSAPSRRSGVGLHPVHNHRTIPRMPDRRPASWSPPAAMGVPRVPALASATRGA
jgi:hypothetical protein